MALGAFLAGVLLAESEYRRELETDIEPFKGLLLGLFFIAVGMSIDFAVVLAQPLLVAGVVLGFLLRQGRGAVGHGAQRCRSRCRSGRCSSSCSRKAASSASWCSRPPQPAGVIDAPTSSLLVAAVAISMLLTPLLLVLSDRWWTAAPGRARARPATRRDQRAAGRAGDHRRLRPLRADRRPLLYANGIAATVLDHDAEQIEAVRRSAGRCSTATRRGWTCCAPPAPTRHACWCWPSTTSSRASRSPSWRASTSRS